MLIKSNNKTLLLITPAVLQKKACKLVNFSLYRHYFFAHFRAACAHRACTCSFFFVLVNQHNVKSYNHWSRNSQITMSKGECKRSIHFNEIDEIYITAAKECRNRWTASTFQKVASKLFQQAGFTIINVIEVLQISN